MHFYSVRNKINSGTRCVKVNWLIMSDQIIRFQWLLDILLVTFFEYFALVQRLWIMCQKILYMFHICLQNSNILCVKYFFTFCICSTIMDIVLKIFCITLTLFKIFLIWCPKIFVDVLDWSNNYLLYVKNILYVVNIGSEIYND